MLAQDRTAGSRMHVLDWLDGGTFIQSINEMLQPTGFFVPQSGHRMPKGWHDTNEARLGKECEALIDDTLNTGILNWWLVNVSGANVPNWDLACAALYQGNRRALVLAEAKAYVKEFTEGARGFASENADNQKQITKAIEEARAGLARHADGVEISSAAWYQFSNRVAFAWKLASHGIPTVLMYLGFTGDKGISTEPLRHYAHWRETLINSTREIFPSSLWDRPIDCDGTPLYFLIRARSCIRQSHSKEQIPS